MGEMKYEPIHGPNDWVCHFTMPEGLYWPEDISVNKTDKLELAESFRMDKFPTIDSSAELNIEFVDVTDKLNQVKTVRQVMDEWIQMVADSKEMRELEGTIWEFFEVDESADNDACSTNWVMKKPIGKMTDDEKSRLRKLLTENFGIKEKDIKKIGL